MTATDHSSIAGLVLAGGQARRLGGVDKAFVALGGKPLIALVVDRAKPQVGEMLISANGDPHRFNAFGASVLADDAAFGSAGPLSGIFTALKRIQAEKPLVKWLALFACDTPFFPDNLVERLHAEAVQASASVAMPESDGRVHPVFALIRSDVPVDASSFDNLGSRKAESWMASHAHIRVKFSSGALDPFFNINTPSDVEAAERFLRGR